MTARKPTALRLIEGNPGKRKINRREPKPAAAVRGMAPPSFLSARAKAEWRRVLRDLVDAGMISKVDRAALTAYCVAWSRLVDAESALIGTAAKDPTTHGLLMRTTSGNVIQSPLVGASNRALQLLIRAAAEMGMTPAARAALEATPPGIPTTPAAARPAGTDGFFAD